MGFEALLALQLGVLLAGTAVHELGHAATAMALGFRVAGVRVGPVLGVAMPAGWRLRFTWEMAAGGELLSLPPRPDGLRWRHAVMITAGPAAHLAAAAAALTAAAATGALPLWLSAATLGGSALANLLPGRPWSGARWTDGRWLLAWLTRPERAAQRVGLGVLQRSAAMGARPREWDGRWAELAAAGPRRPADRGQVAGCLLAYARALDGDEPSRAAAPLARAFSARCLLPPDARAALDLETAFFVARFRGRGALAGRLLDLTRSRRVRLADLERARAAVHLAAGRLSEAEAACDRALAALETAGPRPSGLVVLDRELLGAMRDEARSRPAAQPGQILPGRLVPAGQGGTPSRSAGPEPGAGDAGSGRIG